MTDYDGKRSSQIEDIPFDNDSKLESVPQFTPEQVKTIWRKVDIRLMPMLAVIYLFSFLDRGNIGNAKLEGLVTQLHLTGNRYNIALTMFVIPYCLFECPSNLVLKKFRPSRWLPGITIVWGTIMTLMGLVKSYPQLVGVRVCLGVAEAGLFPGVVYYLTLWYPRHMLQYRIGLFFGAASVSGAFSGILAFGISYMSGTDNLLGWSWIFILEGCATVIVGIVAFFVMVDFPSTAKFLTPEERTFLVLTKKYDNSSVGEEEHFEIRHLKMVLLDWQVWIHIIIYFSVVTPLNGISLFLPSIIHGFGFSTTVSQLLTVPPYAFATTVLLFFSYYSDRIKMRSPFIYAGLIICLIGFSINISNTSVGVKYFGTFLCVAGSYSAFPGVVSWLGNNLSGHYKRGVGMALQIGIGNFGGAIASNIYRSIDAPRYVLGHGIELMFIGIGLIAVPVAVVVYKRINTNRAALMSSVGEKGAATFNQDELRRLGDKAPEFHYII